MSGAPTKEKSEKATSESGAGSSRIGLLRKEMKRLGVDAFLIPKRDEYGGEYILPRDERLAWISGFTGSAGKALITHNRAILFTDGRYVLQAQNEAPDFEIAEEPAARLSDFLDNDMVLGTDPRFLSLAEYEKLSAMLKEKGGRVELTPSPVDALWQDRPPAPDYALRQLPTELAGPEAHEKIRTIAARLVEMEVDAFITNSGENIAWLLNIRGGPIPQIPAPHGFALLEAQGKLHIFGLNDFVTSGNLELGNIVQFHKYDDLERELASISGAIGFDKATLPMSLVQMLVKKRPSRDPILDARARKSPAEIKASQSAHDKDALVMINFLAWLDEQDPASLDEFTLISRLDGLRKDAGATPSFETICGFNANGAIIHYRADESSNLTLKPPGVLLIDSGGHYAGATTDITRTIFLRDGLEDARAPYAEVLSGLANISQARFPKGVSGRDIDALARAPLWQGGRDYAHGTGHGVGAGLSVHEGPIAISRRNTEALHPGMILSLEPGYYEAGKYGIRLENLAVIREGNGYLHFETLTHVPFDKKPLRASPLNLELVSWLNRYHMECRERYAGSLDGPAQAWLINATKPISS